MKVCVLQVSQEPLGLDDTKFDARCDPGQYIISAVHQFDHRFIKKDSYREDIDEICADETYDVYLNCLCGGPRDYVFRQEAAAYLEDKGVKVLTNTASAIDMCRDKLRLYSKVQTAGIRVPGNEPGRFPKVVKLNDTVSSETLYFDAVCHEEGELRERVALAKSLMPDAELLVQDYIGRNELTVVVVEMGHAVVALEPVEHVLLAEAPTAKALPTFDIKSKDGSDRIVRTILVTDEPRRSRLRETARNTFKEADMQGGSGLCQVHMQIDATTGEIYILEIDAFPKIFYPRGSSSVDNIIELTYPGGHAALFDMLLTTKSIQTKAYHQTHQIVCDFYRNYSKTYDNAWDMPVLEVLRHVMAVDFDWSGRVLDLCCGSGFFGNALHDAGWRSEIVGVDISPDMAAKERSQKYYKQPIHTEPIEEFIMTADPFDHIVCCNSLHYLPPFIFTAVLSRMFMLARKSVSFEVYDTPEKHIETINKKIGTTAIYNNTQQLEQFPTPQGWKKVFEKRQFLFSSPNSGVDVHGTLYRFEKRENGV